MNLSGQKWLIYSARKFSAHSTAFLTSTPVNIRSNTLLQKEINRRVRDKMLQSIIETSDTDNEYCQAESTPDTKSFTDSISVERYLKTNTQTYRNQFPDLNSKLDDLTREQKEDPSVEIFSKVEPFRKVHYPYKPNTSIRENTALMQKAEKQEPKSGGAKTEHLSDRGFYVISDSYHDDYVSGSAIDLPQEKQFALATDFEKKRDFNEGSKGKGRPQVIFKRMGVSDAVEEIEFQLPHQKGQHSHYAESNISTQQWRLQYGDADPNIPPAPSGVNCPACGARFHCQNSGVPGFLPSSYFLELFSQNQKVTTSPKGVVCRRCYLIQRHDFLVNVNVAPADYERALGALRHRDDVLIILILDMLDFPCSILRQLPRLIGVGKRVIVVGNKIDLIPPDLDQPNYLNHYRKCLRKSLVEAEFDKHFQLLTIQLISAKTGFGIEELIDNIYRKCELKTDIYLVGCTNSGKSTLFNTLLQSDLCKILAVDLVERATASIWPGTTLNLLKFPVMNPTPARMFEREKRLRKLNKMVEKEDRHLKMLLEQTGDSQYAVMQGYVEQTFSRIDDSGSQNPDGGLPIMKSPKTLDLNKSTQFTEGHWCYDTPGTVNRDQLINILTLDELTKLIPSKMLVPRKITLIRRQSLLIGGIGRVDFVQAEKVAPLNVTVFCSDRLPLYVVDTDEVPQFYGKYIGTKVLEVPSGDKSRLNQFPNLLNRTIDIVGESYRKNCCDIVLSSIGWIALRYGQGNKVTLKVWIPGGVGIYCRKPSLLQYTFDDENMFGDEPEDEVGDDVPDDNYRLHKEIELVNDL